MCDFFYCIWNILAIPIRYYGVLLKYFILPGSHLFSFSTHVLFYICGLWFKWKFCLQSVCGDILVNLIYLLQLRLLFFPLQTAYVWGRSLPGLNCHVAVDGRRDSTAYGDKEISQSSLPFGIGNIFLVLPGHMVSLDGHVESQIQWRRHFCRPLPSSKIPDKPALLVPLD